MSTSIDAVVQCSKLYGLKAQVFLCALNNETKSDSASCLHFLKMPPWSSL